MHMLYLNKIITDDIKVLPDPKAEIPWVPLQQAHAQGLSFVINLLVSHSAYAILIPSRVHHLDQIFLSEAISQLPESMQDSVKVIDKNKRISKKVERYMAPIYESNSLSGSFILYLDEENYEFGARSHPLYRVTWTKKRKEETRLLLQRFPKYLRYAHIDFVSIPYRFLYKLALACNFKAEVDIEGLSLLDNICDLLIANERDDEAAFRLNQIKGLANLYKPFEVSAFEVKTRLSRKSVKNRIRDMFDEAEIIEISRDKCRLGLYDKFKLLIARIKKRTRNFLISNSDYSTLINGAMDITTHLTNVPLNRIDYKNLARLYVKGYNPPIICLDELRHKICKEYNVRLQTPGFHS